MNKKRNKKWDELPCGELRPDDGVDPRILFHRGERRRNHTRKDRQLCKQAFQVFALLLDQLSTKRWAQGVYLAEVVPAPDASRLKVGVGIARPFTLDEGQRVLEQLQGLSGFFRWELGAAISRKKVPELLFDLVIEEVSDADA